MFRKISPIALSLFLFGCIGQTLNRSEVNQRSTFMLTIPSGGQCSGVVLTHDGYILTAGHCVRGNTEFLMVHSRNGERRTEARVIAVDKEKDLALLKVDNWTFRSTARLHSSRNLRAGDTVYHSGFPFGGRRGVPQLFGVGHIMNPDADLGRGPDRHFILIDLETGRPGASGSGVYDAASGGLIGMVDATSILSGHVVDRMTIVILVPVADIREFLNSNGVSVPSVSETSLWSGTPPEVGVAETASRRVRTDER